jgi:iron complex transport system permease protein
VIGSSTLRRRRVLSLVALAVALAACLVASLAVGARPVPLDEVWSALVAPTGTEGEVVVRSLRVPRTALGLAVGIALGLAGAVIQGHTRNPLADPGLLGVSAGAAFAVVLGITLLGAQDLTSYIWLSFAGALVATVLVVAIGAVAAGRSGGATPLALALAGAAVSAFLTAVTTALVLLDNATLDAFRFWSVGSIAGRGTDVLVPVLPFLVLGALLALAQGPALNLLGLGDDVARGLGSRVATVRVVGVLTVTLLTGAAVAACGPISFVGLVVPHVARILTGPDHRWLVPVSGLAGAVLLLAADVVGRVVVRPGELQVGIALAVVGAPFFIALVRRRRLVTL